MIHSPAFNPAKIACVAGRGATVDGNDVEVLPDPLLRGDRSRLDLRSRITIRVALGPGSTTNTANVARISAEGGTPGYKKPIRIR